MTTRERIGKQLLTLARGNHSAISARGKKPDRGSGQGGFTLVEMMITLGLVILFLAGVVGLVDQGFTFVGTHQNLATLNRDGKNVLDRVEALVLGCYLINDAGTNPIQFTFSADIDADDVGETVLIDSSGSNLRVTVDGVQSVVLSNLDTGAANPLGFTYYKEWKHEAGDEVTANYNDTVKVVKLTVHLTKSSSGKTTKKTYRRYILLKLDPDDRKVAD